MRFLVVVVSAGAALTLIAASGLMNWVFMTSLGKSEFEQHILGAVSVAVSAFLRSAADASGLGLARAPRRFTSFLACRSFSPSPRSRFPPPSALPPRTAAASAKTARLPRQGSPA